MYKNILVAIDLNHESSWKKALPTAVELCQSTGAQLTLLTVIPDFGMSIVSQHFPKDFAESAMAEANTMLGKFADEQVPNGVTKSLMVSQGTIYEEIIRAGEKISADLIILAAHRPSLKDYLLGPNASRVVRHFNRSVLIVRD